MKRYRFMNFFIDMMRNFVHDSNLPPALVEEEKKDLRGFVAINHGEHDADEKLDRYLELDPPKICVIIEYHQMMRQVEASYVSKNDYPALTGACCLGERILNMLVLRLRSHYKTSSFYKKVYRRDSIQDWNLAIDALYDWNVLQHDTMLRFKDLYSLRNPSVHYESLGDIKPLALRALQLVMKITDDLFGAREDIFFWCPGEIYVRKSKEDEPIVREFFIPNFPLVGYKHTVVGTMEGLKIDDNHDYESLVIDDDEFKKLRMESARNPAQSE